MKSSGAGALRDSRGDPKPPAAVAFPPAAVAFPPAAAAVVERPQRPA